MDVIKGCEDEAQELKNTSCIALGPTLYDEYTANPDLQADILNDIQSKIPEIEKSLQLVKFLQQKESSDDSNLSTRYNLADMLFAKANVDCASGIVNLWLGANVMLEYTYQEAIDLLTTKLEKAQKDLKDSTEDLALVRNQIITAEVNISRIYNWDVRRKREESSK